MKILFNEVEDCMEHFITNFDFYEGDFYKSLDYNGAFPYGDYTYYCGFYYALFIESLDVL